MSKPTIAGIYKRGRVKLLEPAPVKGEVPILIVFLDPSADPDPQEAWIRAVRKSLLKGYSRRDAAYDEGWSGDGPTLVARNDQPRRGASRQPGAQPLGKGIPTNRSPEGATHPAESAEWVAPSGLPSSVSFLLQGLRPWLS